MDTVSFRTALTWTIVCYFEKSSPQPEIKAHLEFRFNLLTVLLDFQLLTEDLFFECAFAYPIMLFLSYLVKNSIKMCLCGVQISY